MAVSLPLGFRRFKRSIVFQLDTLSNLFCVLKPRTVPANVDIAIV